MNDNIIWRWRSLYNVIARGWPRDEHMAKWCTSRILRASLREEGKQL